ncbi:hypothetical protein [Pedobacter sp. WC2423]|uniref:hypothetical protein n=1 Tax=Pedobacter sp. WC2423 TaxID=3234142 RepID=UPI0034665C26
MSYHTRIYRQRNAHAHEEVKQKPFFSAEQQQAKGSAVQRLATAAEDEKQSTNDARMAEDKEIQGKPMESTEPEKEQQEKTQTGTAKM